MRVSLSPATGFLFFQCLIGISLTQVDEEMRAEIKEMCIEKLDSLGLFENCDDDLNLSQCICLNSGHTNLFVCCIEEEIEKRGSSDLPFRVGCANEEETTIATCPSGFRTEMPTPSSTEPPTATTTEEQEATETTSPKMTTPPASTGEVELDIPDDSGDSASGGPNTVAIGLGVGLGLGIPLVLAVSGLFVFRFCRERRQANPDDESPPEEQDQIQPPLDPCNSPSAFTVSSVATNKRISELMGSSPREVESTIGRSELSSEMRSELPAEMKSISELP